MEERELENKLEENIILLTYKIVLQIIEVFLFSNPENAPSHSRNLKP